MIANEYIDEGFFNKSGIKSVVDYLTGIANLIPSQSLSYQSINKSNYSINTCQICLGNDKYFEKQTKIKLTLLDNALTGSVITDC